MKKEEEKKQNSQRAAASAEVLDLLTDETEDGDETILESIFDAVSGIITNIFED